MSVTAAERTTPSAPPEAAAGAGIGRQPALWRVAPWIALAAVAVLYLALTIARRYEVVADELAAFGAGMRVALNGPFTPNLIEQLWVNPWAIALLSQVVGIERSFVAARWLQGLFGLVTILGTFELTRQLTGRAWLGVVAALLLTLSPFFIHSHHHLRMDNPETAGFVLTLLALAAWIRRSTWQRLAAILLAAAWLVASKLLGLLFLPGLFGVALAWRLRARGGLALTLALCGAAWLAWALPQVLVLRAKLPADTAQLVALAVAAVLGVGVLTAFARPLGSLVRRPRVVLPTLAVVAVVLTVAVFSPRGVDRQSVYASLIQYQLQRFTIALNEDHPGNQERLPEGATWYPIQWAERGVLPETLGLALFGLVVLAADWRRPPGRKLVPHPGAGLLLVLPLAVGFAFLAASRSWFLRYSLPLFPILTVLASLGLWEIARWVAGGLAPWVARFGPRRRVLPRYLAPGLAAVFLLGLGLRNGGLIVEQNRDGSARGVFLALREPFGHEVQPDDVILADHANSWIYDSGLFLEADSAYPLMMLGMPKDVTLVNIRAHGPRLADWLMTDHPVAGGTFDLVYQVDASDVPWHHDSGVVRYFVYRNRYGIGPNEDVRLGVRDLLRAATVRGGNDPGHLLRWTIDGRRQEIVVSHPGDDVANQIVFSVDVQAGDTLRGGYGFNPEVDPSGTDGATVAIRVRTPDGREQTVLSDNDVRPPAIVADCDLSAPEAATCRPGQSWPAFAIDLTPWAGQTVQVVLETGSGPAGDSTYDWTGWSDLRVSRDGAPNSLPPEGAARAG